MLKKLRPSHLETNNVQKCQNLLTNPILMSVLLCGIHSDTMPTFDAGKKHKYDDNCQIEIFHTKVRAIWIMDILKPTESALNRELNTTRFLDYDFIFSIVNL